MSFALSRLYPTATRGRILRLVSARSGTVVPSTTTRRVAATGDWTWLLSCRDVSSESLSSSSSSTLFHDFDPDSYRAKRRSFDKRRRKFDNIFKEVPYQRDFRDRSYVDEETVEQLTAERAAARRAKDFATADLLLRKLLYNHGVRVDDWKRTWRSGCQPIRKNDEKLLTKMGPHGHDYTYDPTAGPNATGVPEETLHKLIAGRMHSKLQRDWEKADEIQDKLSQLGVFIRDETREWRADGKRFPFGAKDLTVSAMVPYRMSPLSEEPEDKEDIRIIEDLIKQRHRAKYERKYQLADKLRDELQETYNVYVHDRMREWCIGKMPY